MPSWVVFGAINLNEYKTGWVIVLLNNVKPDNTWLLKAVAGIFKSGVREGFDHIGFDVCKNMDYEHSYAPYLNLKRPNNLLVVLIDGFLVLLKLVRKIFCVTVHKHLVQYNPSFEKVE